MKKILAALLTVATVITCAFAFTACDKKGGDDIIVCYTNAFFAPFEYYGGASGTEISLDDLMKILPCPDFPVGGYLLNTAEIRTAYETGRGKLINRAKTHFEPLKNGKTNIVITEFPYQVNKAAALEKVLALVQQKSKSVFAGISDIRDESDRTGVRAVIEVKKDFDPQKVLNALFKYSDLQKTVSVIMVAIADGKPKLLGLSDVLDYYIKHRENVVTRRSDALRHALADGVKRLDNLIVVRALGRDLLIAGLAIREDDDHVVRTHIAVDGDHVERRLDNTGERLLQELLVDGEIRRHVAKHRRHVRTDHARAFRDGAEADFLAAERTRMLINHQKINLKKHNRKHARSV